MKRVIKISGFELRHIINESVRRFVNESFRGEFGVKNLGEDSEQYIALQNAKAMCQNGDTPLKIKQTTGWEIGYDGKWKYEGIDGTIKQCPISSIRVLSDIWDDDDLYRWYPQLRNVNIVIKNGNGSNFASTTGNTITIPYSILWWGRNNDQMSNAYLKLNCEKTIQHEIQHVIQYYELTETGAPAPDYNKHKEILKNYEEKLNLARKYKNITKEQCYQLYKQSVKNSIKREFFVDLYEFLNSGYTTQDYIDDIKEHIKSMPTYDELDKAYYSNNGEKEAYEVNDRYGWDYNKRRNNLMSNRGNPY